MCNAVIIDDSMVPKLNKTIKELKKSLANKDKQIDELNKIVETLSKNQPLEEIYKGKNSEWHIEPFSCLCSLDSDKSYINDVMYIDEDDFVNKYDHNPEKAEPYACADMRADIIPATSEVLLKYKISLDEYHIIANEIATAVSFGNCGWCV